MSGATTIFSIDKFKGLWLRKILNDNPQQLEDLENLRVCEEGYLRIRAGVQKPKPIAGSWTASSPIRTGSATSMVTGGTDCRSPWPVIMRCTALGVFSADLSQQAFYDIFNSATVGERFYIISQGGKWSTGVLNLGRAAANLTIAWEYPYVGGETALPGVTDQLNATGERIIRFSPPTSPNWSGGHYNGYFGFAIWARITAVGGGPVIPRIAQKRVTGDMPGRRMLVVSDSDTQVSAQSAKVYRYGPQASPLETRFPILDDNGGTGLDAGYDAPMHFTSRDGVLYYTNGFVQRRFQGDPALNSTIGFAKPSATGFSVAAHGGLGSGQLTGTLLYGIRYGYGPNGAWGKGPLLVTTSVATPAAQHVDVTFPTEVSSLQPGIVDVVYVYRSWPLEGAQATTYNSQPLYQIAAVARQDSNGTFPQHDGLAIGYQDNDPNFPWPLEQGDARDLTPPSRVKFLIFHKNRLVAMNSRENPTRAWPSLAGNYEAFDTLSVNGYQDFSAGGGDEITGGADYNDMLVVFTNRSMHALVNLDTEDWSAITIHPELGCVAPETIVVAYGRLFWLSQLGPMMWDGENPPEPIGWPVQLEELSPTIHGMSRAIAYGFGYELELIALDRGVNTYATQWPSALYASLYTKYHYSLRTKEWGKTVFSNTEKNYMQPICSMRWPHYTDYEGRFAPVYGRHRVGDSVTDLRLWMGEAGTTDDGSAISFAIQIFYGPKKAEMFIPERWLFEALNISLPACSVVSSAVVGDKPIIKSSPAFDGASSMVSFAAGFSKPGTGCAMVSLRFSGTTTGLNERNSYVFSLALLGKRIPRKQPI